MSGIDMTGKKKTHTVTEKSADRDVCSVMLTLQRPAPEALREHDRGERYRLLRDNSAHWREEIVAWLQANDFADEVYDISAPNAFNMLFMTISDRVYRALPEAPGVVDVSLTDRFAVEEPPTHRRVVAFTNGRSDDDDPVPPRIRKVPRQALTSDFAYWQQRAPDERLAALETARTEYNQWKYGSRPRFQKVLKVAKQT